MIVFDLMCRAEHRFEGWFSSGDDVERQRARGLLNCPVCGSGEVTKLPSSKIKRSADAEPPQAPTAAKPAESAVSAPQGSQEIVAHHAQIAAFISHVMQSTEDVGKQFAAEARKIHNKEAPERAIRGQASREEARELLEEGIPVLPLPIPPQSDLH